MLWGREKEKRGRFGAWSGRFLVLVLEVGDRVFIGKRIFELRFKVEKGVS